MQNGVKKVMEDCSLRKFCIGNIDCLKDGFELGKRYKNATDCVVSCCEGDNCDPSEPDNSNTMPIASSLLIGTLVGFVLMLKI